MYNVHLYQSSKITSHYKVTELQKSRFVFDGRIRIRKRTNNYGTDRYPEGPKINGSYGSGSEKLLFTTHQIPNMNKKQYRYRNFKALRFTSICDVPYGTCTL
jgi:hypothetical protein